MPLLHVPAVFEGHNGKEVKLTLMNMTSGITMFTSKIHLGEYRLNGAEARFPQHILETSVSFVKTSNKTTHVNCAHRGCKYLFPQC